jgi:hypothetical protein
MVVELARIQAERFTPLRERRAELSARLVHRGGAAPAGGAPGATAAAAAGSGAGPNSAPLLVLDMGAAAILEEIEASMRLEQVCLVIFSTAARAIVTPTQWARVRRPGAAGEGPGHRAQAGRGGAGRPRRAAARGPALGFGRGAARLQQAPPLVAAPPAPCRPVPLSLTQPGPHLPPPQMWMASFPYPVHFVQCSHALGGCG